MAGGPGGHEVGRISIRVVPDTTGFRKKLEAELKAISEGLDVEVDVDANTKGIREKIKAETKGIKAEVKVDVDRSKLDFFKDKLGGLLGNLSPGRGGGGLPLGAFADNLALVAGIAAIAAPALALISGALTAMPAIAAAVVAPIGAIALGLDGIKKAAEVLKAPLDSLKASVSGVFESRLTPVFQQLATLMPRLEAPMGNVANGISDIAESFVNMLSAGGMDKVEATLNNIADTISKSAPGLTKFTDGLLGLAQGVSAKFPGVATWIDTVGKSFSEWVDKVTKDGSLDRAMGNLGDTLKPLLDTVGDLAKQGFDWLQDPAFAQSMKDFVSDFRTIVNDLLPALKSGFQDVATIANGIVTAIDKIKGFEAATGAKKDNEVIPGTENRGPGGIFPGVLKDNPLSKAIDETKNSFQATVGVIEGFFLQMWFTIQAQASSAILSIQATIQAGLSTAFSSVVNTASAAWNGIVGVAQSVVGQVNATFLQIPGQLQAAWSQLVGAAQASWQAVVGVVQGVMGQIIGVIASSVGQIIAQIASIPGKAAGALAGLAGIGKAAGAALVQGLVNGITSGIGAVAGAAAKLAAAVASHMPHSPAETGPLSGKGWVLYSGQAIGQGLADGMLGQLGTVTDAAQQLAQAAKDEMDKGVSVDQSLQQQIKPTLDALELQRKNLQVQKDAIPKGKEGKDARDSVQAQMDQITALKHQLDLQKDQLGFSDKYASNTDSVAQANSIITDQIAKMIDLGKGFVAANANQFMSDLGISGNGAVPTLANMGLDWATGLLSKSLAGAVTGGGTTINVNNVDDAIAAKRNIDNRKALQYRTR